MTAAKKSPRPHEAPANDSPPVDPRLQPFIRALAALIVADLERNPLRR